MFRLNPCIQPPVEYFIEQGAALYCRAISSQVNESVTVTYRLLNEYGTIRAEQKTLTVAGSGTLTVVIDNLPDCWLLSLTVSCSVATVRGQTYFEIIANTKDGRSYKRFLADYVVKTVTVSFPPASIVDPLSGTGYIFKQGLLTGASWTYQVPAKRVWRLLNAGGSFVADATVQNRMLQLGVMDSTQTYYKALWFSGQITASQTVFVTCDEEGGLSTTLAGVYFMNMPIKRSLFFAGDIIKLSAINAAAGDAFAPASFQYVNVEEYLYW